MARLFILYRWHYYYGAFVASHSSTFVMLLGNGPACGAWQQDLSSERKSNTGHVTVAANPNKMNFMGKVAEIKTKQNSSSVDEFIESIEDAQKRKDARTVLAMMEKATKETPAMWGSSMIGFGKVRYKSPASGREVDWFKIGFAPRKSNLSLHLIDMKRHADALAELGKHKTGDGCLYINNLDDVDLKVLEKIIAASVK
jgi:hypothetical protein